MFYEFCSLVVLTSEHDIASAPNDKSISITYLYIPPRTVYVPLLMDLLQFHAFMLFSFVCFLTAYVGESVWALFYLE